MLQTISADKRAMNNNLTSQSHKLLRVGHQSIRQEDIQSLAFPDWEGVPRCQNRFVVILTGLVAWLWKRQIIFNLLP